MNYRDNLRLHSKVGAIDVVSTKRSCCKICLEGASGNFALGRGMTSEEPILHKILPHIQKSTFIYKRPKIPIPLLQRSLCLSICGIIEVSKVLQTQFFLSVLQIGLRLHLSSFLHQKILASLHGKQLVLPHRTTPRIFRFILMES